MMPERAAGNYINLPLPMGQAPVDETEARCPQSVYVYRVRPEPLAAGYRHEFVLGALLSRTMNYLVLKRFAEADPAKAFAKLTHKRLADLPIPKVDFTDRAQAAAHKSIVGDVKALLDGGAPLGGVEDTRIEQKLRWLWGISPDEGAYINGEFYGLPEGQLVRSLFPEGPPLPVPEEPLDR